MPLVQRTGERVITYTFMYILISHNHYLVATVFNYENNLHRVIILFTSVKFSRALTTPRSLKLYKQIREHIITSSHCGPVTHTHLPVVSVYSCLKNKFMSANSDSCAEYCKTRKQYNVCIHDIQHAIENSDNILLLM